MNKPILYLDMDDVLVDFNSSKRIPLHEKNIYGHPAIYEKGFFIDLLPMPGGLEFVKIIINEDLWDVYILTQPVSNSSNSYKEKVDWVSQYLPLLQNKIIMTQDKTLLKGHVLIDDNIKWKDFDGEFIYFDPKTPELSFLSALSDLKEYYETKSNSL